MEPSLTNLSEMIVAGIEIRTKNQNEMDPATARIAGGWEKFYRENLMEQIPHKKSPEIPVAVYCNYDSDHTGTYSLVIGAEVSRVEDDLPDDFDSVTVHAGNYLLFRVQGPMPQALIEAWIGIWEYFAKNSRYKRAYVTDVEIHRGNDSVDVYISLQ